MGLFKNKKEAQPVYTIDKDEWTDYPYGENKCPECGSEIEYDTLSCSCRCDNCGYEERDEFLHKMLNEY
jgi:hypothetical protein